MSKINLIFTALLLLLLSIGAGAQSSVCLDFEDLKPGDRYGKNNDAAAGDVIYQKDGVDLSLSTFFYPNGTEGYENLLIEDAQLYDSTNTGVSLFPSNINLKFDLSGLPAGKKKVCIDFQYFGGDINFAVNGNEPYIFSNLQEFYELQNKEFDGYSIDFTTISASRRSGTICITGENLEEILIGGQEFVIDNLCIYFGEGDPECELKNLIAEPHPCTPNGIFYLDLEFDASRDSGQYQVIVNNQIFGPFNYPLDSFLSVGPIQTYGDQYFGVTVYDLNHPDCQISTRFEHTCFDICNIDDLVVEAEICPGDETGKVYIDFEADIPQIANTTFKVWIDSTEFGEISLLRLPFALEIPAEYLTKDTVPFTVCLSPNLSTGEECCISGVIIVKRCDTPCEITDIKVDILNCYDGIKYDLYVDAAFKHQYRDAPVQVLVDGNIVDTVRSGSFPIKLEGVPVYTEALTFPVTLCQLWSVGSTSADECCITYEVNKRDCPVICPIEAINAKIVKCRPNGNFDLLVKVQYNRGYEGSPFIVYVEGENLGLYEASSDGLLLEDVPVYTDALTFELKVCPAPTPATDPNSPEWECCKSVRLNKEDCNNIPPSGDCTYFEDLDPRRYSGEDYAPGTEIFRVNDISFRLFELQNLDWTVSYGGLSVTSNTSPLIYPNFDGQFLFCSGISTILSFNDYGENVEQVQVDFYNNGGHINVAANGSPVQILSNLTPGVYPLGNGVELEITLSSNDRRAGTFTFRGNIQALLIGGQELALDNLCINEEEAPCDISDIRLEPNACDEEGYYYLNLDFEYEHTSDYFIVAANNNTVQRFKYDELPVKLGPFNGISTTDRQLVIEVYDAEKEDCAARAEFGPYSCIEPCVIEGVKAYDVECSPLIGFYGLTIDIAGAHLGEVLTISNQNGFVKRFEYNGRPVRIEGIPLPGTEFDKLTICGGLQPNDTYECCYDFRVQLDCYPTVCEIRAIEVFDIECDSTTGLYHFSMKVDGENLGDVVYLSNGNGFSTALKYDGEVIRLKDITIPRGGFDQFTLCARPLLIGYGCCYDFKVETDCIPATCEIREVKVYDIECDPNTELYNFNLKIDGYNLGDIVYLSNDNGFRTALKYEGEPIKVSGVPVPEEGFDKFYLCAKLLPTDGFECCYDFKVEIDCSTECTIEYVEAFDFECFRDGTYSLSLKVIGTGVENGAFVLTTREGYETKFRLDGNKARIDHLPYPADGSRLEAIKICKVDADITDCCYKLEYQIDCTYDCGFSNVKLFDFECSADGTYSVSLKVDVADFLYGKVFYLKTEGGYESRFEWKGEAIRLDSIPIWNNDRQDRMKICVADFEDCCLEIDYKIDCEPYGECQIGELYAEAYDCEDDGTFFIKLDFRHENTSDGFEAYVNGMPVGSYRYADLPVRLGPIMPSTTNSGRYKLEVKDLKYGCSSETVIEACDPPAGCAFESVDIITKECEDGYFNVVAELDLNQREGGFLVFVEGDLFGPYRYSENQRIEMGPFKGDGVTSYDFLFVDLEDPTCYYFEQIGVVECENTEDCNIDYLRAKVVDCNDDGSYRVYIDFEYKNPGNDLFDVITNDGSIVGTYPLRELPLEVDIFFTNKSKIQRLGVCINDQDDCCEATQIELPDCNDDCEGLPFRARPLACDADGQFNIALSIDIDITVIYPITIKINGEIYDSVEVANPSFEIGPFPADSAYTISIIDLWHPECVSSLDLGEVHCNDDCGITDVKIDLVNCNADGSYELYLDLALEDDRDRAFDLKGADGNIIQSFKSSELPIIIPEVKVSDDAPYLFVCEQDTACCIQTFVQFPECVPCNFTKVEGYIAKCLDNQQFYIGIKADWDLDELDHYIVTQGDIAFPFIVEDSSDQVFIGPFASTGNSESYTFWLTDVRLPNCTQKFEVDVKDACKDDDSDVWPGDANQDKIANHLDLINLGIAWGKQGPARTLSGSRWTGVPASSWGKRFTDTANSGDFKHADCNGDGIVNEDDIDVIRKNYNLQSGQVEGMVELPSTDFDPPVFFEIPENDGLPDSGYFNIPIMLGSEEKPLSDIYGVAFTIEFDPEVIDPNDVEISYPTSWLGEPGVNLQALSYKYLGDGKIEIAITRTDQNEVSGYGVVAMFRGIRDDIVGRHEAQLDVNRSFAVRSDQSMVPLHGLSQIASFKKKPNPDQKYGLIDLKQGMRVYPNPTSNIVTIENYFGVPIDALQVLTPNGKVMTPRYEGKTQLDVSALPDGLYLIRVEIDGYMIHQKLFKSKSQ